MWQGPRLGFVAETGPYAIIAGLSTIFLLFSSFLSFVSLGRFLSSFFYLFLQPFVIVWRNSYSVLFHHSFLFLFGLYGFYFLGWLTCVLVPGTSAFHLLTVTCSSCDKFGFLWVTVCDHIICISLLVGWRIRTDTGCVLIWLTRKGSKKRRIHTEIPTVACDILQERCPLHVPQDVQPRRKLGDWPRTPPCDHSLRVDYLALHTAAVRPTGG